MSCVIWSMNKESCNECPCENCGGTCACTPENPRCHEVCSVCETGINTEKFEEALRMRADWNHYRRANQYLLSTFSRDDD